MVAVIFILGTYEVVTGIIDIASVKEVWIMAINNPVYIMKNAIMLIALIGAVTYLLKV